ncbi:sugar-transfer associated ATP-grasp domain-containing protein [Mangrovimonas sp. TPBH4]|uniref:sugar-transfer associated ATP-grasp domain-containing protein n=1 Tax=Mangrovimonas sp. TPBH4 TaxID=1645914 RepID=UPI0006B66786|nr:sugar-transfer associated ATP-grasp domain-containing protein [Mangrovimonas sp. TPBH4]
MKQNRLAVFLKDKNKKPPLKIIKECTVLLFQKKEIPFYYFKYLYRKNVDNYQDYIGTKEANRIKYKDTFHKEEYLTIISNKLNFSLFCKQNDLPVPALISYNFESHFFYKKQLYVVEKGKELLDFFKMVFEDSGHSVIFLKPISLYGGTGCYRLSKDNLEKDLELHRDFILQNCCIHEEVVIQHENVNKIHPNCVNTIRVETFIDKQNEIHILSAFMRFGVGSGFVDNAHAGGFYVGIDLESGTLREVGHQYMEYGGAEYTEHPDSGFVFKGYKIPFFKEVKELVFQAVNCLPDRYIGWDIAVSKDGPVIIEANEYPSIFMADIAFGGYLKHPLYRGILEEVS